MPDEINMDCNFLVAGAGYSGICAAIQAGRLGLETILVEKEMMLGGNGGPNLGVGAHASLANNPYWNETGIIEEIESEVNFKWATTFPTNFAYNVNPQWDQVVTELLENAGVKVLRKHLIISTEKKDDIIESIELINIENLDRLRINIDGFILDATGDAIVADLANADCYMGRESENETGERSAPEKDDNIVSAASITALVVDTGQPKTFVPPEGTPSWNPEKPNSHFNPEQKIHFLWQVDEGGEGKDNHPLYTPQKLYRRLVQRIFSQWNYLKNELFSEKAKNHQLIWISPILGKRESRRIIGDYLLTQTDIESCKTFKDAIGFGGGYLDEHLPSFDGGYEVRFYSRPLPYDIPLRSIYSRNINNLLSGGRAIGVSHLAFTSTRLMRTGGMLGQAAAIVANFCFVKGITPRIVANKYSEQVQKELLKNDVWVIGAKLQDSKDLTNEAVITATSQAKLSSQPHGNKWKNAENGLYALIYQYPEELKKFAFYVRNNTNKKINIKGIMGYGETSSIKLLPVPQVEYNQETNRYEEEDLDLQEVNNSKEETWCQPTGTQGFNNYSIRYDHVTNFKADYSKEKNVPTGFEGWIEFKIADHNIFPAFDRKKPGQAVVIGIEGDIELLVASHPVDVVEGLVRGKDKKEWDIDLEDIPVFNITPDPIPGDENNITDGYIHREGRAKLHQWMSSPDKSLPQSIKIDLLKQKTISKIQICFDVTERLWKDMYLMHGKQVADRLVADYKLEIFKENEWRTIINEKNNYLRFREHILAKSIKTRYLRLVVNRVWGKNQPARIYDIRVYSD